MRDSLTPGTSPFGDGSSPERNNDGLELRLSPYLVLLKSGKGEGGITALMVALVINVLDDSDCQG